MAKRSEESVARAKAAPRTPSAAKKTSVGKKGVAKDSTKDSAKDNVIPTASKGNAAKQTAVKKLAPKKAVSKKTVARKVEANAAQTPLPDTLPVLPFASAEAWESWLESNADAPGLWLKIAKKNAGIATVSYEQALDVALCHGWIDGQKRGFDECYFLQRFTPRRPKSLWSKINIGHVERLVAAGRMRARGLREVDAAKADGRWNAAYDGASRMEVPEALTRAFAKNKAAAAFFATLDKTNRYAVCWRVHTAKTDATRAARIEGLVAMLARGEKIHP